MIIGVYLAEDSRQAEMKGRKSSIDLLERVIEGGVHVEAESSYAPKRGSSRESLVGGIVNSETGWRTHPLSIRPTREQE